MPSLGHTDSTGNKVFVADATIRDGVIQAINTAEQTKRSGLVTLLNGITGINLSEPVAADATMSTRSRNTPVTSWTT